MTKLTGKTKLYDKRMNHELKSEVEPIRRFVCSMAPAIIKIEAGVYLYEVRFIEEEVRDKKGELSCGKVEKSG